MKQWRGSNRSLPACNGGDSCCTPTHKCGEDDGDCDIDADCKVGLKCGEDNCSQKSDMKWDKTDDCCYRESGTKLVLV